jgi:diguanylate cyclase (GGDEF)-like protein
MWWLPPPPVGTTYSFPELMEHGRTIRVWDIAPEAMEDYVARRIALVRAGTQPPVQLATGQWPRAAVRAQAAAQRRALFRYAHVFRHVLVRAQRQGRPLSLMMIDADHFRDVNDRHGHAVGDEVLCALAERCRGLFRGSDILGRIGGEEFAAALTETDLAEALDKAERVRREVAGAPIAVGEDKLRVTVSVGVAARGVDPADSADLLQRADRALYAAKAGGRNRVSTDPGLS